MMKWTRNMLLMPVLLAQALSSCSLIDEPEYDEGGSVKASLTFLVSGAENRSTRMADDVVQNRIPEIISMIPFVINPERFANNGWKIVDTDELPPKLVDANRVELTEPTFFLYRNYDMELNTNAFLVYGKPTASISDKAVNGSLLYMSKEVRQEGNQEVTTLEPLSDITMPNLHKLRFTLEPFCEDNTAPDEAGLLADYLTYIAETPGWSTDETLKNLFLSFTGQNNEDYMVMAGSTANVIAHVNALYKSIYAGSEETGLKADIRSRIQNLDSNDSDLDLVLASTGTNESWKLTGIKKKVNGEYVEFEYPASEGLPDGAAALRWAKKTQSSSKYEFVPQVEMITWDNINNINNINRFCYPAELFYYVNSRIDTSDRTVGEEVYNNYSNWEEVREQYEYQPGIVTGSTKSVAIHEPLQYAVGRLKINMKAMTETLNDSKGDPVTLTSTAFPLTGVIVCNQHPVDFNFKPVLDNGVAASHVDDRFIYDSQVKKSDNTYYYLSTTEESIPSTLVLQTYDTGEGNDKNGAEEVTIAMEFQNNSGQTFKGKDCVIYPGTKFYLIGTINPLEATSAGAAPEAVGRVFTQDHVTTVNTMIESLANAYNVLPDLIGGRLELGLELVSSWVQAETTNVILK